MKFTLKANATRVPRKCYGRYIYVRSCQADIVLYIGDEIVEAGKGSHIGPIDPAFTSIEIDNTSGLDNLIDLEISRYPYGQNLITLDKGEETSPIYTAEQFTNRVARNMYQHNVAAGARSAFFLPPDPDNNLKVMGISLFGTGQFDIGYTGQTEAAIISEGVWNAGDMGWAELGAPSGLTGYTMYGATSAIANSAAIMGPVNMTEFMPLPLPAYLPAGHSVGLVLAFKNVTGMVAQLGAQMIVEVV